MLTEKEKLEEELKLLEESLSLDVITQDEFEYAKQRIEVRLNKLKDLEQKEEEPEKESEEEPKPEEEIEIKKEELAEEPEEEEEKEEEQKKLEEIKEEAIEEERPEIIFEKEKKSSKRIWAYIAIILIFGFVLWYFFFPGSSNVEDVSKPVYKPISLIACSSD
mgnify:FL=1